MCVLCTLLPLWYSLHLNICGDLCRLWSAFLEKHKQLHSDWERAQHSGSLLCHWVTIRYLFAVWKGIQKACTKTGATVKRGWAGRTQWNTGLVINIFFKNWFKMLKVLKTCFNVAKHVSLLFNCMNKHWKPEDHKMHSALDQPTAALQLSKYCFARHSIL